MKSYYHMLDMMVYFTSFVILNTNYNYTFKYYSQNKIQMRITKLFFYYIVVLSSSLLYTACSSDDKHEESAVTYLRLSTEALNLTNDKQTASFDIETDGPWEISAPDQNRFTISENKGTGNASITIDVEENSTSQSWTETITVKAGSFSKQLVISQSEKTDLSLNLNTIKFIVTGGEEQFTIQCNRDWVINDVPDWLTIDKTEGTGDAAIKVSVGQNFDPEVKTAVLKIVAGSKTVELSIRWESNWYSLLSVESIYEIFTKDAAERTIVINSNRKWKIENLPSWIKTETTEGAGNANILIKVDPNNDATERDATIKIVAIDITKEIYINQWTSTVGSLKGFNGAADLKKVITTAKGSTGNTYITTLNVKGVMSTADQLAMSEIKNLKTVDMTDASIASAWASSVFKGYITLEKVLLPTFNGLLGSYLFEGCTALKEVNIPEGYKGGGDSTFKDCTSLKSVNLPLTFTEFGQRLFSNCSALETINIPEGTTQIPYMTFTSCSNLKSIKFPSSLKGIGQNSFGKTSLEKIELNEGLETIGFAAFSGTKMPSPVSITIPASVTTIEKEAFAIKIENLILDEVTIKGNPTLGEGAFSSANIKSLYLSSSTPLKYAGNTIFTRPFSGYNSATLYVPVGSKSAYQADPFWNLFNTIIEQ